MNCNKNGKLFIDFLVAEIYQVQLYPQSLQAHSLYENITKSSTIMDMYSKGIILQHLISFIISPNYVFSCQFSEQWRSCSYYNLLFCCFSGDHDCHSNTTNILSVDIKEKTIANNPKTKQ